MPKVAKIFTFVKEFLQKYSASIFSKKSKIFVDYLSCIGLNSKA